MVTVESTISTLSRKELIICPHPRGYGFARPAEETTLALLIALAAVGGLFLGWSVFHVRPIAFILYDI
jgi:hypothetical protein